MAINSKLRSPSTNHSKYFLIKTKIGVCAISWKDKAVTGFYLPEATENKLKIKLNNIFKAKAETTTPTWLKKVIGKLKKHFNSKPQDFSDVPIYLGEITDFTKAVYEVTRIIAPGKIITYQDIAIKLKRPRACRAVGSALGKNPILTIIPCHRVIASSGKLGGFSAPGGLETKIKLLEIEGINLKNSASLLSNEKWKKAKDELLKRDKYLHKFIKVKK